MGQLDMVGRERREKGREGEVDDKIRNKERKDGEDSYDETGEDARNNAN